MSDCTGISEQTASSFVTLSDGLRVHYRENGEGPLAVVFVPGWTMTTDVFRHQLEYFKGNKVYRFITFDPRSHGLTATTDAGNTYEQHGRDLHAFLRALHLDDVVLCGWSFGTLAMLACLNQCEVPGLRGVIMLDGPPRAASADPQNDWATYSFDDADGSQEFFTLGKLRDAKSTNVEFAKWMLEDPTSEAIDWIVGQTEQTPNEVAALLNASAVFLDYRETLIGAATRVPTWCIVREAELDRVSAWSSANIPSATIAGFGEHMMFWERSERFNRELIDFLKNCPKVT